MENSQKCLNFFVTDCSEKISEKICKLLSVIADDCYIFVDSQYTVNGFGLYVFQCETNVELPYDLVQQICNSYHCRLVFSNVTLQFPPKL